MVKILRKFRILPTWKNNWVKQLGKNWYAEMKKKIHLNNPQKIFYKYLGHTVSQHKFQTIQFHRHIQYGIQIILNINT